MDELVQLLVAKAGVTEAQATKSIETIKEYIQSKLPVQMAGIVDNFFASNAGGEEEDYL